MLKGKDFMDETTGITDRMGRCRLVPVVVLEMAESAIPVAAALQKGQVDVMEIALRTEAALDSIRQVRNRYPEILCGAGTVTSIREAEQCLNAGAQFIVSPGFLPDLVDWSIERKVAIIPGCVTPSEILQAKERGLRILKFFPARVYGGLDALKALAEPFHEIKFVPTGGVDASNLSDYLEAPNVHSVGGSWLCSKQDIAAGAYDRITAICQEAVEVVRKNRARSGSGE